MVTATLWWYSYRHTEELKELWIDFDPTQLQQAKLTPVNRIALVVHFVDRDCPCSRFAMNHIETLEATYASVAEFRFIGEAGTEGLTVPAGPSVAIWDQQGTLAYYGPYSSGFLCGQGDDLMSAVMEQLKQGTNPEWINQQGVGCFCEWPGSE